MQQNKSHDASEKDKFCKDGKRFVKNRGFLFIPGKTGCTEKEDRKMNTRSNTCRRAASSFSNELFSQRV